MTTITIIAALIVGYVIGFYRARWTEVAHWRPIVTQAYRMGRKAGKEKEG